MGLFDRFKKKAEDLYNNVASSIQGFMNRNEKVDTYSDDYEFQSDKVKNAVLSFKENVENNPYITCARLMDGETTINRLDVNNFGTLRNLKTEFEQHDVNGPTLKKMLEVSKLKKNLKN